MFMTKKEWMRRISGFLLGVLCLLGTSLYGAPVEEGLYDGLNRGQVKLLKERLRLFDLSGEFVSVQKTKGPQVTTERLIRDLNLDLEGDYFKAAQKELGLCPEGDCLHFEGSQRIFTDGHDQRHCYPSTDCDYYKCMEEQYRCMDVDVPYFQELARPTCKAYKENINKGRFSAKGEEWIYTVMVCLQKGLFEECSLKGNCPKSENSAKTCSHITEFTLNFHPGCYIKSGVGVCKLPLRDQINIWKTVGPFLTKREKKEAFKVVRYCLFGTPI